MYYVSHQEHLMCIYIYIFLSQELRKWPQSIFLSQPPGLKISSEHSLSPIISFSWHWTTAMFWAPWLILAHRLIMCLLIPEFSAYLEYSFCDKLLQIHLLKVKRKIYSNFTCGNIKELSPYVYRLFFYWNVLGV